jgi:uncharacterized membrane protein
MKRLLLSLLCGVIGAGIIHLCAVLILPGISDRSVAARSLSSLPLNRMSLVEGAAPGLIRFADTTAVYAFCPFSLDDGTLRIVSQLGETPMSFVFLAPNGAVFSALTDRAASRGIVDLRLGTAEQIDALADLDDPDNPPTEYRVIAPNLQGTVVIKAFMATPSLRETARQALAETSCGLG